MARCDICCRHGLDVDRLDVDEDSLLICRECQHPGKTEFERRLRWELTQLGFMLRGFETHSPGSKDHQDALAQRLGLEKALTLYTKHSREKKLEEEVARDEEIVTELAARIDELLNEEPRGMSE